MAAGSQGLGVWRYLGQRQGACDRCTCESRCCCDCAGAVSHVAASQAPAPDARATNNAAGSRDKSVKLWDVSVEPGCEPVASKPLASKQHPTTNGNRVPLTNRVPLVVPLCIGELLCTRSAQKMLVA